MSEKVRKNNLNVSKIICNSFKSRILAKHSGVPGLILFCFLRFLLQMP